MSTYNTICIQINGTHLRHWKWQKLASVPIVKFLSGQSLLKFLARSIFFFFLFSCSNICLIFFLGSSEVTDSNTMNQQLFWWMGSIIFYFFFVVLVWVFLCLFRHIIFSYIFKSFASKFQAVPINQFKQRPWKS